MANAREIALHVLPFFAKNVLSHNPLSYGYYARKIGRDPAKEAMIIGQAMHVIGAVCIFQRLPVAPLHYVKRFEGEARQVFASNPLETEHVLPHVNLMRVVASKYQFTGAEFEKLAEAMRRVLIGKAQSHWKPHYLWRYAIKEKPKDSAATFFQLALSRYETLYAEMKTATKEQTAHG